MFDVKLMPKLCLVMLFLMIISPLVAQDDGWPLITFENFEEIKPLVTIPHDTEWGEIFFLSDREFAIVWKEEIAIWDVERQEHIRTLSPKIGTLAKARITRVGSQLVMGGHTDDSGSIRTWDLDTEGWVGPVIELDASITALAVSPDQNTLAVGFYDHEDEITIELREYPSGDFIRVISVNEGLPPPENLVFLDDTHLVGAERGSGALIYNLETDEDVFLYQDEDGTHGDYSVDHVTLSPSGQYLAWIRNEAFAEIWDWREERKLPIDGGEGSGFPFGYWTMVFNPDEQFIMSFYKNWQTEDSHLTAWSITTYERVETEFAIQDDIHDTAFNPDGRSIAVLYRDTIELWGVPVAP